MSQLGLFDFVLNSVPEQSIPTVASTPTMLTLNAIAAVGKRDLATSWKARAQDNLRAMRLARELAIAGRRATDAERRELSRFVGFGATELAVGLFPIGDVVREGWQDLHRDLRAIVDDEGYASLARSTQYAHYTPTFLSRAIWQGAQRLGFAGGRILEPGCGSGLFMATQDAALAGDSVWTGVEMDATTAAIAAALQPGATIICGDFTKARLPGGFDLAIGNPPFANTRVTAGAGHCGAERFLLHDYFIARSIELLCDGGLLAMVVTHGTMDKANDVARSYIAQRADLLAAIRLPKGAMRVDAGTDVVVDVLFMRRRSFASSGTGEAWLRSVPVEATGDGGAHGSTLCVNEYFARHPENVLGTHAWVSSPFGPTYACLGEIGDGLTAQLHAAIARIPRFETSIRSAYVVAETIDSAESSDPTYELKEGSYYVDVAGRLRVWEEGRGALVAIKSGRESGGIFAKHAEIIRSYVSLRNALRATLQAQAEEIDFAQPQLRLNRAYDAFVQRHGIVNLTVTTTTVDDETGEETVRQRTPNLAPVLDDPDCWLVASIEHVDLENGTAAKGPIFTRQVVRPNIVRAIETPSDALAAALDERGRVDIDRIAELLGVSRAQAIAALDEQVFRIPGEVDRWETADAYLSGSVRKKLAVALRSVELEPDLSRNIEALEQVQPADLTPEEITVRLGAPYLSADDVTAFVRERMDIKTTIYHNAVLATWHVEPNDFKYRPSATSEWGTADRHAGELLKDALNNAIPKIYDTFEEHGTTRRVLNAVKTEAAKDKYDKIMRAFSEWIFTDDDRKIRVVRLYNDLYNDIVPRVFDGRHLSLPGASAAYTFYPHQKQVIWRVISTGSTYVAHSVGAGKTLSLAAIMREQRRLGLVRKPMLTVPGHCLAQASREFLQVYPTANILVADEATFSRDKRKRFVAKAATGDWDAIIITHSAFKLIATPTDFEERMIADETAKLETIEKATQYGDRTTRKRLEQRKEALKARLESLRGRKDDMITIAEIGVDQILVDEAQNFRKLSFQTNAGSIKGIDPTGSQRAWDLFVKTRFIEAERNPRRALVLASGTPITNTLGELYTIQRYLGSEMLEEKQIAEFDAWAKTFGESATELELQPSGQYKPITRFCQFVNVPELVAMFRMFADVVQKEDLRELIKLPTIATGKRQIVTGATSDDFKLYQQSLAERIDEIQKRGGRPEPGADIILSVITDGRHAAVDLRLVGGVSNDTGNKLNALIANVYRIWQETGANRYDRPGEAPSAAGAGQMIFSDLGTVEVGKKRGFSAYEWIRSELMRLGVPGAQIAFMQDYKKSADKQAMFNAFNAGRIRVLIGSSETMGTGVNVQRRLKALHHLDVPWLPSQIEQREGRIERQGNMHDEIAIFAYATPGSMDAPMWQTNERKARFIALAMSGDRSIRRLEDASSQANQFAVAKAIASGNPLLMQKAGLDADIARLRRLRSAHCDDQFALKRTIYDSSDLIPRLEDDIRAHEDDLSRREHHREQSFAMLVDGRIFDDRAGAGSALIGQGWLARETQRVECGTYASFPIVARARKDFLANETIIEFGVGFTAGVEWLKAQGEQSAIGLTTKILNAVEGLDVRLEGVRAGLDRARRRFAEAKARHGRLFEFEDDLSAKVAELREVEAQLLAETDREEQALRERLVARAAASAVTEIASEEAAA